MGFWHVEAALQAQLPHQTGIDMGTLKLVLVAICEHASNDSNYCFPSTRRLARMTGLGKSTCAKAIEYLNCMGCFLNYAKGGGRGSSSFIIDLDRLKDWAIDWAGVRDMDATDEESVHHVDANKSDESRSVHPVDVVSTTETSCPPCSTQRPPADLNQSFNRSGDQSKNYGKGGSAASSKTGESKTESVKTNPDCSLVARTTTKPKATPDPEQCAECLGEEFEGLVRHHDSCSRQIKVRRVFA